MSAPYNRAPLGYQGLKETNPPNLFFFQRAPTSRDFKLFDLGDIWIDQSASPDPDIYMLVDKEQNIATWVQLAAGTGGIVNQFTVDGGTVVDPMAGNVNIFGGTGIVTSGSTPTITISTSGIVATNYPTDVGTSIPIGGVLRIIGGSGIVTSTTGPGNEVTVAAVGPSGFVWQLDNTTPIAVVADAGHVSETLTVTYILPTLCAFGDEFAFVARDTNGFIIQAGAGQTVQVGTSVTNVAGTVASTAIGDTLMLLCTVANTQFMAINRDGNFNFT